MSQSKNDKASVSTYADHEIITPPNKLRKVVSTVSSSDPNDDPVARAEEALAQLSDEFSTWMDAECRRLDRARHQVKAVGFTKTTCEVLFLAAHDIKGEAATFGYPWIAALADSLCRLVEHTPDMTRIPLALVDQHVDAVRAIFREHGHPQAKAIADQLTRTLRNVCDDFLKRQAPQESEVGE